MNRLLNRQTGFMALLFLTWGTVFLDRMSQLYLAPFMVPALHLTNADVGELAGMTGICWAFSTLIFGALSDRIGRRAVLIPAIFAFSALLWLSGIAHGFEQLLVIRGLIGVAEGPCWSVITALVEERSAPEHRGRDVGIIVSAASLIGLAVAPILTTQVAAHFGWRAAFFVAGVPGFILGVLVWRYVDEPRGLANAARQKPGLADYLSVLKYRNMWLCCLGSVGVITWLFEVSVFAPLYITQVAHQPATTAGFLLGASGLGAFFGGLFYPALSDKIGRKPALVLMSILTALLTMAMLTPALYANLWLLAGIFFITNAQQAVVALTMVLVPTETVPARLAATAIGMSTLAAEFVGATLAPSIGGRLAQHYGLAVPLYMAIGGTCLVFVAALLLKETARRPRAAEVLA
jgi:predicted MFS family arabinose efflux permease